MTTTAQLIQELLRESPFHQALSPGDLEKVAAIGSVEQFEPPTTLFHEGGLCDRLYLVSQGLVALEMCMPRRGCVRILTVGPREIVGWSALLSDMRMTARATVVESSTLIAFPARQLRALCDADHDVGYAVMTQICLALSSRLLATRLQLLDIFGETQPADESES